MFNIGLTGSFGTGKSTVAKMFSSCGAKVIDTDKIARLLAQPKGKCFNKIVRIFGKDILKGKTIDRRKLAEIVFKNSRQRKKLEKIIHPEVRKEVRRKILQYKKTKQTRVVVVEVPLLFETGFYRMVDATVVVKANRQTQIDRLMKERKLTKKEINQRIKAQWPLHKKIKLADYVVDNRSTRSETRRQVQTIWKDIVSEK